MIQRNKTIKKKGNNSNFQFSKIRKSKLTVHPQLFNKLKLKYWIIQAKANLLGYYQELIKNLKKIRTAKKRNCNHF